MTLLTPLWCQPVTGDADIEYPAAVERAALIGSIYSREGVLNAAHLAVGPRAAGANFTVDVAPGRCAIFGDDISDQGTYLCPSTAIESVGIPAKPASGTRYHRLIARVKDKAANSTWTGYTWALELLADTGSGLPALPASAISLAQIAVSSTTTSITKDNITDLRSNASVGTADRTGTWTVISSAYTAQDATRPLRYQVNADGRVMLSGWARRTGATTSLTAKTVYTLTDVPLPAEIRPNPAGYRDMLGIAWFNGPVALMYSVTPAGHLTFTPAANDSLVKDSSWFSFENLSWLR